MDSVRTCVAMRLVVETRAGQELILESPESPWLPEEKNSVGLVRVYHIFNPDTCLLSLLFKFRTLLS
jgi:hypothetical protein